MNGSAWHDADFDDVRDPGERPLAGWSVELYRDNQLWHSVLTDANGVYRIIVVEPNDVTGIPYELRFRAPGAGANTAMLGRTASPFTNGMQRITNIIVPSGANLQDLNLPIHPNGVIYNSMARTPIAGATLTLLDASSASPLPASCFDDAAQQGQITLADGYYKFDVNFSDPACPSGGDYLIEVTAPSGANYVAGYSQIIPPTSSAFDRSVLGAGLPGQRQRCDSGHNPVLRSAAFGVRAGCIGSATQRRHDLPRPPDAGRQPDAGLEPDLQQPHPDRSGHQPARSRSPRRRRCST